MTNIIDKLGANPEPLRQVTLAGPMVGTGSASWPMWVLSAGSPSFGYQYAVDDARKPAGTTADNAHPLRVLSADKTSAAIHGLMRPRMMAVHLVIGADSFRYHNPMPERERLLLAWENGDKPVEVAADEGRVLRTVTEGEAEPDAAAPFIQVTTELLIDGLPKDLKYQEKASQWDEGKGDDGIPAPPMRLVGGRVGLYVNPKKDKGMNWLDTLGIVGWNATHTTWKTWPKIWLVPDGIEFDAQLQFPGRAGAPPLEGRVLLQPEPNSTGKPGFRLKLVAATNGNAWQQAWADIIPEAGNASEALMGFRFPGRHGGALPAFSWPVAMAGGTPQPVALNTVEVDARDCGEVALVSPPVMGVVDTVAGLRLARVKVRELSLPASPGSAARTLVEFGFKVDVPESSRPGTDLVCRCTKNTFTLGPPQRPDGKPALPISLDVELASLVAALRAAYGIATPPPVSARREPGLPYGQAFGRPLIPAFVALDDGWLQLPIPNLGPLDTSSDQLLSATPRLTPPSALDGFLRLRHVGLGEEVQSGYDAKVTPARGHGAPWSLTVEQAAGLSGWVRLLPRGAGTSAQLEEAELKLLSTVLSTRGLLWLSSDRPDAQEALPRLGAGPAAFVDALMQTTEAGAYGQSPLVASFDSLAITIPTIGEGAPSLTWGKMTLQFRTDSKRWVEEVLKPEEARKALAQAIACITGEKSAPEPEGSSTSQHLTEVIGCTDAFHGQLSNAATNLPRMEPSLKTLAAVPALKRAIKTTVTGLADADSHTRTALAGFTAIQQALNDARAALPAAAPAHRPWPAVAWLRHPVIPLATTMPMTRAASGSSRPLESRDLFPFALIDPTINALTKPGLLTLAHLKRDTASPLLQLDDSATTFDLSPVHSWPHAGGDAPAAPDRGIAMASVGVPGVELRAALDPPPKGSARKFEAALRYDLPLLDEAFATASLPPPEGADSAAKQPSQDSVATALDWTLLADFWRAQERKQQNSRVVDSYVSGYIKVDAAVKVDVTSLIRGLCWSTEVQIATTTGTGATLPYGSVEIKGCPTCSGNIALAGYEGSFTARLDKRTLEPAKPSVQGGVEVLGFSPATFDVGGIDLDNNMSGAGVAIQTAGVNLIARTVTYTDSTPELKGKSRRLLSLLEPVYVSLGEQEFAFWFKDVLFADDAAVLTPADAPVPFDTFDNDAKLASNAFEWRFAATNTVMAGIALELGRGEIPLHGLYLEPLRLLTLSMQGERIGSASLLCRLSINPRNDPANLVLLTLKPDTNPCRLVAHLALANPTQPLRFGFDIAAEGTKKQGKTVRRRVLVTAGLAVDQFALEGKAFALEVAGQMIELGVPDIKMSEQSDGRATVLIRQVKSAPSSNAGVTRLRIEEATITAGYELVEKRIEPIEKLEWRHYIDVFPQGEFADRLSPAMMWSLGQSASLCVLGCTAVTDGIECDEANGALSVRAIGAKFEFSKGTLASVDGALLARLGKQAVPLDGTVALAAGHCEVLVIQSKCMPEFVTQADNPIFGPGLTINAGRLELHATTDQDGVWQGSATVSAALNADSDIAWPSLTADEAAFNVPLPQEKPNKKNSGRVRVTAGAAGSARHHIRWTLNGHRLPLSLAAALCKPGSAAVWVTPVVAHHRLTRKEQVLAWTGIESLAVGRPAGMVPAVPDNLTNDARTWAARYAHAVDNGKPSKYPEAGMYRPGLGAVATVLQGALGNAFRTQFQLAARPDRLMLAGGFLGLLKLDNEQVTAPLLRLPVLTGTGLKIGQSDLGSTGIELAWSDGPAARSVALSRPTAPSPSSTSFEALADALLAGSLTRSVNAVEARAMSGALLVEQSFLKPDKGSVPSMDTTPFFLASAVSVSAILDAAKNAPKDKSPTSLSLVSGTLVGRLGSTVSLAASVSMRATIPVIAALPARRTLYVLGAKLREVNWDHANSVADLPSLTAYLRALASTYDQDPVGFLLAIHDKDTRALHVGSVIESLALDPGIPSTAASSGFADGRRGIPALPKTENIVRWLAPPREGPSVPIRDATLDTKTSTWTGSGLAGLARRMTLPAHAGAWDWDFGLMNGPPSTLVWLSSAQVPVYLPLRIAQLRGAPISWLQPAPPQVRLPTDNDVAQAIVDSKPQRNIDSAARPTVQPFLPGHMAHSSVGERAGVMSVRRSRLLTRLDADTAGSIGAYDASNPRFGAPGQAGSSWARKLRTPRPGPLPENRGDPARDRRIQASNARPLAAGSAWLGSADIVQGGKGTFGEDAFSAWAIQVVACAESASVISERWDAVLRLACRLDLRQASRERPAITPADFVRSALFGQEPGMGACLKIDARTIAYRWIKIERCSEWGEVEAMPPGDPKPAWYSVSADVELILDPREAPFKTVKPATFAPFAQALAASGIVPQMELQWTVLPRSGGEMKPADWEYVALTSTEPAYRTLVKGGAERASLTLRIPLYPVMQAKGALGLTPATLIFSDPAYDRDLAGPPASARKPLTTTTPDQLDHRGDLRLSFYVDRGRVNRHGVVTLMLDIAYERRMDELAQASAEAQRASPGGDLMLPLEKDPLPPIMASVELQVVDTNGKQRKVEFGAHSDAQLKIELGTVYELPLVRLVEIDGKPAVLAAGDLLQIDAALIPTTNSVRLWNTTAQEAKTINIDINDNTHCMLPLTLTEEAVVEPPPALYLALQRSESAAKTLRLSVPLHVQSPLPRRVDLMDPARGFRSGLLKRHADFVWYLSSPDAMLGEHSIVPLKSDRNGQGYWPITATEFLTPQKYTPIPPPKAVT
jgi:hypothetical protein